MTHTELASALLSADANLAKGALSFHTHKMHQGCSPEITRKLVSSQHSSDTQIYGGNPHLGDSSSASPPTYMQVLLWLKLGGKALDSLLSSLQLRLDESALSRGARECAAALTQTQLQASSQPHVESRHFAPLSFSSALSQGGSAQTGSIVRISQSRVNRLDGNHAAKSHRCNIAPQPHAAWNL